MKMILEQGDKQYFESIMGQQIPDDVWGDFEDWINSNMYGTLIDQCAEQLENNL